MQVTNSMIRFRKLLYISRCAGPLPNVIRSPLCSSRGKTSDEDIDSHIEELSDMPSFGRKRRLVNDTPSQNASAVDSPGNPNSKYESQTYSQFSARRKLSPSQRLGSMLPDNFWKMQDQEVIDSVQMLDATVSENSEENDLTTEERDHLTKPFNYGEHVLISFPDKFVGFKMTKILELLEDSEEIKFRSFGTVKINEAVGKCSPVYLTGSKGKRVCLSRPSIEEYYTAATRITGTLSPKVQNIYHICLTAFNILFLQIIISLNFKTNCSKYSLN